MRWLGQSRRAFDMLCERALTRYTHGSILADKQMIEEFVAESYAERQAARLLTLHAAWTMDELHAAGKHYSDARVEIGVIKFWGAKVLYNVIDRAIQVHGSLGYTTDLPLESMYRHARAARIYDGPDEVHKVTVARQVLKGYRGIGGADRARPDPARGGDREVRRPARRPRPQRLLIISRQPLEWACARERLVVRGRAGCPRIDATRRMGRTRIRPPRENPAPGPPPQYLWTRREHERPRWRRRCASGCRGEIPLAVNRAARAVAPMAASTSRAGRDARVGL